MNDYPTSHTNGTSNGHSTGASHADAMIDLLYSWVPPTPAPAPAPEMAFSLTLKGTFDGGQDALITVRGQTAAEFKHNLAAIRGLLDPVPAPAPASPQGPPSQGEGWCHPHRVQMRWNPGKDGAAGWYSHKGPDGRWCKGR